MVDDAPEPRTDLTSIVSAGKRVESLTKLRDHLAFRLENSVDDRVVAPIAKQLADVMAELEKLNPPEQESAVDDLATKRAARRKAAVPERASGGGKQRRGRGAATDGVGGPPA